MEVPLKASGHYTSDVSDVDPVSDVTMLAIIRRLTCGSSNEDLTRWIFISSRTPQSQMRDRGHTFAMAKSKACTCQLLEHSGLLVIVCFLCLLARLVVRHRVVRPLGCVVCGGPKMSQLSTKNTNWLVFIDYQFVKWYHYCKNNSTSILMNRKVHSVYYFWKLFFEAVQRSIYLITNLSRWYHYCKL